MYVSLPVILYNKFLYGSLNYFWFSSTRQRKKLPAPFSFERRGLSRGRPPETVGRGRGDENSHTQIFEVDSEEFRSKSIKKL